MRSRSSRIKPWVRSGSPITTLSTAALSIKRSAGHQSTLSSRFPCNNCLIKASCSPPEIKTVSRKFSPDVIDSIEYASAWKVRATGSCRVPSDARTIASRISDARSRPKVRIRIESAGAPDRTRLIAHSISVVVLPVPVAPRMISGAPRWAIAASCS